MDISYFIAAFDQSYGNNEIKENIDWRDRLCNSLLV